MDLRHVQGNVLVGFNQPHAEFLLLRLPQRAAAARGWLGEMGGRITSSAAVAEHRSASRRGARKTWYAVGLTRSGLEAVGLEHVDRDLADHYAFLAGAEARAADLGDVGDSDPSRWRFGSARNPVDAVVTVAAGREADLEAGVAKALAAAASHHALVVGRERGHWPEDRREHFGFVDGGGQPRVRGVDPRGDLAPGEFVVDGAGPDWLQGASFQVLRLLEQDVNGWRNADGSPEARLGRRTSGKPLAGPVPPCSHVGNTLPGRAHDPQQRHRLIRRGIPYGPPYDEAPDAERGMVFNAFVASIGRQYEYVQRLWANQSDFPLAGAGWDPVIGGPDPRELSYRDAAGRAAAAWPARFVHTRGALYAVALSPSAVRSVASGAWASHRA